MKKIILLLLFLLVVIYTKATIIIVQNTNDNGVGSLRQAVLDAKTNDTIRFNPSLIKNGSDSIVLDSAIIFSKNLIFKGLYNSTDTLFISGNYKNRIFMLDLLNTDLKLVLDSMFLKNAYSKVHGAGIFIKSNSAIQLQILHSKIENCKADSNGGGIYINTTSLSTASILNIENSNISDNFSEIDGAGIYALIPINLRKSIISNNISNRDGGGMISFSSIQIAESEISYNSGDFGGGVTCFAPKSFVKIENSTISNNTSYTFGAGMYIFNSSIEIKNTTFTKNTAKVDGGGIYVHSNDTTLPIEINNSTLSFNTATEGFGGAISGTFQKLSLNNSIIINNNSFKDGGGISTVGRYININLKNTLIKNNNSLTGNGGGIYANSTDTFSIINIENSTVASNYADKDGGGIFSNSIISYVNITNSTISNHSGYGLYSNADSTSTIHVKTSTIMYNGRGIISLAKYTNLTIAGSILAENKYGNLIQSGKFKNILSNGYNIFGDATIIGSHPTDSLGIKNTQINLSNVLQNNGGITETLMPLCGSIAIDAGNPTDTTTPQNGAIFNGRRDIGAAEYFSFPKITTSACDFRKSPSGKYFWNKSGTYYDTIIEPLGCISYTTFFLTINNITYSTLKIRECFQYESPSGKYIWKKSGYYEDTIQNVSGCDSIISIQLNIDTLDLSLSIIDKENYIIANQTGAIYQWIDCKDSSEIKGETKQNITPKKNGNYAVIITHYSCKDTSECLNISNVGINKDKLNDIFQIFSNPNNGIFEIQFKDAKNSYTIVITDVLGKIIQQFENTESTEKIDLSNYENGIYLVNISNEFASQTIKIVKQ